MLVRLPSFSRTACAAIVLAMLTGETPASATVTQVSATLSDGAIFHRAPFNDVTVSGSLPNWTDGHVANLSDPIDANDGNADKTGRFSSHLTGKANWSADGLSGSLAATFDSGIQAQHPEAFTNATNGTTANLVYTVSFDKATTFNLTFAHKNVEADLPFTLDQDLSIFSLDASNNATQIFSQDFGDQSTVFSETFGPGTYEFNMISGLFLDEQLVTPADLLDYSAGLDSTLSWSFKEKAAPAVPEPTSWAMMLGGFGLIGGTMRARRTKAMLVLG